MNQNSPFRILGVDYGERRVGLAVSDPTGTLAGGLRTLTVSGMGDAARQAAAAACELGVRLIVVGKPYNMDGSEGRSALRAEEFATLVGELAGVETVLLDERLTTSLAHVYMNATGASGRKRKAAIDALSAQIILQDYLDSRKK